MKILKKIALSAKKLIMTDEKKNNYVVNGDVNYYDILSEILSNLKFNRLKLTKKI